MLNSLKFKPKSSYHFQAVCRSRVKVTQPNYGTKTFDLAEITAVLKNTTDPERAKVLGEAAAFLMKRI